MRIPSASGVSQEATMREPLSSLTSTRQTRQVAGLCSSGSKRQSVGIKTPARRASWRMVSPSVKLYS